MQTGEIIAGRFRVDERAEEGGMGTVFKGTDLSYGQLVAIKVMGLKGVSDTERFEREAKVLAELSHPGIVRFIASGELPTGERYLVMEWVQGETVAQRLQGAGMNIVETVTMGLQLANALHAMHSRGVIHRDLKPKNLILVDGQPSKAMILDFGIARHQDLTSLTRTGVMVGTLGYMAPEQARGTRDIDGRLDLFALGSLFYECLTGKAPFVGADPFAVRAKILLADPAPVQVLNPDVSDELNALVVQLLEKEPDRRPSSAELLAQRLTALRESPGERHPRGQKHPQTTETRILNKAPSGSGEQPSLVCMVVLGTSEEDLDSDQMVELLADRREKIRHSLPKDCRLEVMEDGWCVVTLSGHGLVYDVTVRAARCALKLRQDFPDIPMAIAAQKSPDSSVEELIDRGAQTVVRESLESLFADAARHPGSGAIRVDDVTVELLPEQFEIIQSASGYYLMGERGVPL